MKPLTVPIVLAPMLAGCITVTSVEPWNPQANQEGFRYSLPEPYLMVSPAADCSVTYQWLYLPNEGKQYVVSSYSILGKYSLDLKFQNGQLVSAGANQDSTSVAAQALGLAAAAFQATKSNTQNNQATNKTPTGSNPNQNTNNNQNNPNNNPSNPNNNPGGQNNNPNNNATLTPTPSALCPAPTNYQVKAGTAWGPVLFHVAQTRDDRGNPSVSLVPVQFPPPINSYQGQFQTNVIVTQPTDGK